MEDIYWHSLTVVLGMFKKVEKKQLLMIGIVLALLISSFPIVHSAEWLEYKSIAQISDCNRSDFTVTEVFQPFLIELPNGTLVCTFEAREGGDDSKVDIYYMTSTDGGGTWSESKFFDSYNEYPYAGTYCDYYLWEGERLWRCINSQFETGGVWYSKVFVKYADGNYMDKDAYSSNIEVFNYSWDAGDRYFGATYFYPTNPGIYTSTGYKIFPCQRNLCADGCFASILYTDKSGTSASDWEAVSVASTPTNENSIVELTNGDLYDIMRNQNRYVWEAWNYGGDVTTWTNQGNALSGNKQPTKSFLTRLTETNDGFAKDRLALAFNNGNSGRFDMSVGLSLDEGVTWSYIREFDDPNPGNNNWQRMYPHMISASNGTMLVAYSAGEGSWYSDIKVARMNVEWVSSGADSVSLSDPDPEFIDIEGGTNQTTIYTATPTFNWSRIDDADKYHLQVSNDSSFNSCIVDINNVSRYTYPSQFSQTSTKISFTLPDSHAITDYDVYYCRVRAYVRQT